MRLKRPEANLGCKAARMICEGAREVNTPPYLDNHDFQPATRGKSGLDAQDLLFFGLGKFVDLADVVISEFLDFLQCVAFGVFGD
jgi:hypothetical protein